MDYLSDSTGQSYRRSIITRFRSQLFRTGERHQPDLLGSLIDFGDLDFHRFSDGQIPASISRLQQAAHPRLQLNDIAEEAHLGPTRRDPMRHRPAPDSPGAERRRVPPGI